MEFFLKHCHIGIRVPTVQGRSNASLESSTAMSVEPPMPILALREGRNSLLL